MRQRPCILTRRDMLARCAVGFGGIALHALLGERAFGGEAAPGPLAPKPPHFAPKVRSVIFLYMDGGVSQVDSFDPKPLLQQENGKPFKMKMEPTQFNNNGNTLGSPWAFRNYGQSGIPISDLFPHLGTCAEFRNDGGRRLAEGRRARSGGAGQAGSHPIDARRFFAGAQGGGARTIVRQTRGGRVARHQLGPAGSEHRLVRRPQRRDADHVRAQRQLRRRPRQQRTQRAERPQRVFRRERPDHVRVARR